MEALSRWLQEKGVRRWDLLLWGDGSGNSWGKPIGWGAVSVERLTRERILWEGGASSGTNNVAEAMAYLLPLSHFTDIEGRPPFLHVHVFTDSQYVVTVGTKRGRPSRNKPLWAALHAFRGEGVIVHWHHISRSSASYNILADLLAGRSRRRHMHQGD